MENIGLEISIFLFAAFLSYIIAVRIGQSAVVAMIVIGIILGPGVLGVVSYSEGIRNLAQIGAILLLFVVGLECNFKDIYSGRNALIAICGIIFPFVGGFLLTFLFGFGGLKALFVGIALTATSIAITAHVLKEMGKISSEAGKAIIGAAVIDDVLGLLMLAVVTGVGSGEFSILNLVAFMITAVLFLLIAFLLMPIISVLIESVNSWAEKKGQFQITILLAMAIAFAYSAAAELVGLSSIVGAFIAGVTLENLNIKSYREGAKYLEMIFSAIFFVSLGILINFSELDASIIFFTVLLVIIAVITKVVACYLPALLIGLRKRDALIVGIGMVPRGEVAMIVALFGLSAGIIGQTIYTSILLMSLATTLFVPFALKKLYRA